MARGKTYGGVAVVPPPPPPAAPLLEAAEAAAAAAAAPATAWLRLSCHSFRELAEDADVMADMSSSWETLVTPRGIRLMPAPLPLPLRNFREEAANPAGVSLTTGTALLLLLLDSLRFLGGSRPDGVGEPGADVVGVSLLLLLFVVFLLLSSSDADVMEASSLSLSLEAVAIALVPAVGEATLLITSRCLLLLVAVASLLSSPAAEDDEEEVVEAEGFLDLAHPIPSQRSGTSLRNRS
mmetsp:Transcript_20344/g.45229  ORF Transcript_20344/g.45229 Transcript_20344/m.45229 type:complete len:238 (-) Transcript_20344:84-797(-)